MAIRILRLIEYVYKDEEAMSKDMPRWTMGRNNLDMMMRSAIILPEAVTWLQGMPGEEWRSTSGSD